MAHGEGQDYAPTFGDDTLDSLFEGEYPIPSPALTDSEPQKPSQASPTMMDWTADFILPDVQQAGEPHQSASVTIDPELQPTQASPTFLKYQEWLAQNFPSNAHQDPPASALIDAQLLQPAQAPPTISEPWMQYPPPDAQQPVEPYPRTQNYHNGSLPANFTQLHNVNRADYTQQRVSTVLFSTPTSHVQNVPAHLKDAFSNTSWLLHGQPPREPEGPSEDAPEDSYPDGLALSSEDEPDTPRHVKVRKVHKGDKGDQKKGELFIHRANADRDPERPWVVTNKTKGLNNRAAKIANYKPEENYTALSSAPASWQDFKYTIDGELERGKFYSVAQIEQFLYQHPLHNTANGYDRKNSGLIVWIQKNPADSARRYPTSLSSRCRFADCFAINNTINQGQYRVTFDEQSHQERNHDPHHNAGYVHLYCLEKHLDFPKLCANLNVRVENRNLPSEPDAKNRMLMSSAAERITAEEFVNHCTTFGQPLGYPFHQLPNRPHEGTLAHKLAVVKVENEPTTQKRLREARGQDKKGTALKNHLGNLEIETVERAKTRKAENQNWRSGEPRKRKRGE